MVKFPLKALSGGFVASSPRGRAKYNPYPLDKHPFIESFLMMRSVFDRISNSRGSAIWVRRLCARTRIL